MVKNFFDILESSKPPKVFTRNIIQITFDEYRKKILKGDGEINEALYDGDIFIVKSVYDKEYLKKIKNEIHQWGLDSDSSFHKITEGVPDFHRIIDRNNLYNIQSKWHCYYFFNFNKNLWDVFQVTNEMYYVNQILMGSKKEGYLKSTPKDGAVVRIQVVHYPQGGGFVQAHNHYPLVKNKYSDFFNVANVGILSEKGKEYSTGGLYCTDENMNKIYIDDKAEIGDVVVSYGLQNHGVEPVDPNMKTDWSSKKGRWTMLFGNIRSDIDQK